MKRLLIALFMCLSVFSVAKAADTASTQVQIKEEATNICNFYYEIIYRGERIREEKEFELLNASCTVIDSIKTKDGIIDIEKIFLGNYFLRETETGQKFFIKADEEYVKTQHILKPLILNNNDTVQTGDCTILLLYVAILLVSLTVICISVRKRRENSE